MKEFINSLRMLLAERLLFWALSIAPECKMKDRMIKHVGDYAKEAYKEYAKECVDDYLKSKPPL